MPSRMSIDQAWERISPFVGRSFQQFVPDESMRLMRRNKGKAGQLMEKAIGLRLSTRLLDFVDGDLKTYKSMPEGMPRETMAIHTVGREIDNLVGRQSFQDSNVCRKTQRLIVLGICKDHGDPAEWFVSTAHLVDGRPGTTWHRRFEDSYYQVLRRFHRHLETSGQFHTSSGDYIQLRTKDAKPYKPLYSEILGRYVTTKNIAFYFQKSFMEDLVRE